MKKIILLSSLFISHFIWCQKSEVAEGLSHPTFSLSIISNNYFGENYLAKGHKSNGFGFQFKHELFHYKNFNLGFGIEKSTQKVTDTSIGGNIYSTNSNSVFGLVSYKIPIITTFAVSPEINYGRIELRQKNGSKLYGVQNGTRFGLGLNLDYMIKKNVSISSLVSYNKFNFNTETSPEFINYFNNSKAISISLGLKFNI